MEFEQMGPAWYYCRIDDYQVLCVVSKLVEDTLNFTPSKSPTNKYIWFKSDFSESGCCYFEPKNRKGKELSLQEFLSKLLNKEEDIVIADRKVEFKEDGIQVGCTFVPTEVIDKIYERLHK